MKQETFEEEAIAEGTRNFCGRTIAGEIGNFCVGNRKFLRKEPDIFAEETGKSFVLYKVL